MRTLFLASALPLLLLGVACGDGEDSAPFGSGGTAFAGTSGKGGTGGAAASGGKAGASSGGSGGATAGNAGRGGKGGAAGSGGAAAGRGGTGQGGTAGEAGGSGDDGGTNPGGGAGASGEGGTGGPVGSTPVATINHPGDGEMRNTGDMIPFVGVGTDAEDGVLTGASLVWTSDVEGAIGTGESFNRALSQSGTQVITLTVTDSDGNTGTDSIELEMQ